MIRSQLITCLVQVFLDFIQKNKKNNNKFSALYSFGIF